MKREPVKPSKGLLQGCPYVRSERTDIRATFERIRAAQQQVTNVKPINTKRGSK